MIPRRAAMNAIERETGGAVRPNDFLSEAVVISETPPREAALP